MSPYPKQRARRLRRQETTAEARAWQTLRTFRKLGFPVRRQHPIEGMIVDFAIPSAKLVIEIDDSIHNWSEIAIRDAERDETLKAAGWDVLRLSNEVANSPDHLFAEISQHLGL